LHAGVFEKDLPGQQATVTVKLDLVTGEQTDAASLALIQDLNIGRLRGVELALDHTVTVSLTGQLPSGADNTVFARIADMPSFLCTKAFALNERKKEKDAYDVYFCLRHFPGGPKALAEQALAALKNVLPTQVRVFRQGSLVQILARDLVRGDVMQLEEGDRIPPELLYLTPGCQWMRWILALFGSNMCFFKGVDHLFKHLSPGSIGLK